METYDTCLICGGRAEETHHLLPGTARRNLAEIDHLTVRLCFHCHRMLHDTPGAEGKSKQLGEALFELRLMINKHLPHKKAQETFLARYGRKYI